MTSAASARLMTFDHATVMARTVFLLSDWQRRYCIAGRVTCGPMAIGDANGTPVSADVAFLVGNEILPTLAIEIADQSDTFGELYEKIDACLDAGVSSVWLIYPRRRTIVAYTGDRKRFFTEDDTIDGGPRMPGFHVRARSLFESCVDPAANLTSCLFHG